MKISLIILMVVSGEGKGGSWGFFAHRLINKQAIFSLPPEMIGFYKDQGHFLTRNAVNPDRRRYAVKVEAARHYIDIDHYGDSAVYRMPRSWNRAVEQYSEDTLNAYGIVPWHINLMRIRLTRAFRERNFLSVLRLSADLGHYIADAHVPLHTTENYNGQFTGQHGIHGFWESRLPELFASGYDLWVGQATYLTDPLAAAWIAVANAHQAVDSVLSLEKRLTDQFPEDKKYSYEERGASLVRVYSRDFSRAYHENLAGMVERQLLSSIKMVASFWFTCWVDAGQPVLKEPEKNQLDSVQQVMSVDPRKLIRVFRRHEH